MFKFHMLIFFFLTLSSVRSGYYETKNLPIYYQAIEPLETLEQKYFNLFLSNPYQAVQTQNDNFYLQQYNNNLLDISNRCPKNAFFASYNPIHRGAVAALSNVYKDQKQFSGLLDIAQFLKTRPEIHPHVWFAGLMRTQVAQMPETLSMQRPSPLNLFPTSFFPNEVLGQGVASQQCQFQLDERVGQDNGVENLVWYFREDVQLNAHHWIWHLLFPVASPQPIERRGEFFYFFHHELIARYGTERIANGLPPQPPLNVQVNTVIPEGYNPHLRDGISTANWAPRAPFTQLAAALNSTIFEDLVNLTTIRDRFLESLFAGTLFRGDVNIPIHTIDNINLVGEVAEGSNHSINPLFYGMDGYHNVGHWIYANLIGNAPQGEQGVMGHVATAMRDPVFYRWHKLVDILFLAYKANHLAPYNLNDGDHPLIVNGLSVADMRVVPNDVGGAINLLHTYWNFRRFDLQGGIDFNALNATPPVNTNICAKHLDHEEFTYQIQIVNSRPAASSTTVRIFMAPRYRTIHEKIRYTMAEQRSLFFMMDSFQTVVQPGNNLITRRSEDSTVTAPWPKSVEQIRQEIESGIRGRTDCECGFPHHLLLPKGTERGMTFDLFVMLTDGATDQVVDNTPPPQTLNIQQCVPSHVQCGIQGRRYPDAKPMGYPFDRVPFSVPTLLKDKHYGKVLKNLPVAKLEDYVSHIPNSFSTQIIVRHQNVQIGA